MVKCLSVIQVMPAEGRLWPSDDDDDDDGVYDGEDEDEA